MVDSAEDCLARIGNSYPGWVALVMLQFPTPYRFQGNNCDEEEDDGTSDDAVVGGFNAQLSEGAASDDFMVTEDLLSRIHGILSENDNGRLLIQSNCEDVTIRMRNVAGIPTGRRFASRGFPGCHDAEGSEVGQRGGRMSRGEILECTAVDPVVRTDRNGGCLPAGCKAGPQVLTRSIVKRAPTTFVTMGRRWRRRWQTPRRMRRVGGWR